MEMQGTVLRTRNTVLMILVCVAGCGGGGKGLKMTPEQQTGATALCNKGMSCGEVTSSQMQECTQQIAGALQVIPDPDAFSTCIQGMSCSDLDGSDETKVQSCLNLDTTTIKCESGGQTLHACSNSGKCVSISCADACPLLGGTFDHCGFDSSKGEGTGWDVCYCRM
jgi:hypothetical protein